MQARDTNHKRPLIVIGVMTKQASPQLERLLSSLAKLTMPMHHDLCLIIVQNQRDITLAQTVEAANFTFPVAVIAEPVEGVASARNRLLAEADVLGANLFLGVNDDQAVCEDWGIAFEKAAKQLPNCDAFMGWVEHEFEGVRSAWMSPPDVGREGFGERRAVLTMDNYALRRSVFSKSAGLGMRFDTQFNGTGKEELEFFRRFERALKLKYGTVPQALSHQLIREGQATVRAMLANKWHDCIVHYQFLIDIIPTDKRKSEIDAYRVVWGLALLAFGRAVMQLLGAVKGSGGSSHRLKQNLGRALCELVGFVAFFGVTVQNAIGRK